MRFQLLIAQRASRKKFIMEDFIGSDDIFALVTKGSFSVVCNGEMFTVKANEGMLFRKNTLYHREVVEPVTMYLFRYKAESPAFDCDHVVFKDQVRLSTTLVTLEMLDREVFGADFEYRSHLFDDLVMQYEMETLKKKSEDEPIERIVAEINRSLHKSISLSQMGERCGLSYVQFLRRFKAFTGVSPIEYVAERRLQKAKQLLADTDLLVKDIAFSCGFENEYYFSNFFKKHTNMSPTAFRSFSS